MKIIVRKLYERLELSAKIEVYYPLFVFSELHDVKELIKNL